MPFRFQPLTIPGVILAQPHVFCDERGFFMETYKRSDFCAAGIVEAFVQDNHSHSRKGVIRGLHYQKEPVAQGKLVRVVQGEVFDVAVDIRTGSPTYGKWVGMVLSAANRRMLYVPPWCAHGFCVVSDEADVVYKVTQEYAPDNEAGIIWSDADLAIAWPVAEAILAPRDAAWPPLRLADINFVYTG